VNSFIFKLNAKYNSCAFRVESIIELKEGITKIANAATRRPNKVAVAVAECYGIPHNGRLEIASSNRK